MFRVSFVLKFGKHRTDFHKLLANWTCNADVTISHEAVPIKDFPVEKGSFPQDLHYVLRKLQVMLTLFLGHIYELVPSRFTLPGIPCILNYLFPMLFMADKEDQTFI